MKFLPRKIQPWFSSPFSLLVFLILTAGAVLRINHYLENRSLRLDEAALALDLMNRSLHDIAFYLKVNFFNPSAPSGFLFLTKILVNNLGNSEFVLRLLPLAAGLAALPLYYFLLKRCFSTGMTMLALGLFALCDAHIFYSADFKPYALDVAVTLGLLLGYEQFLFSVRPPLLKILFFGLFGIFAMAVSFPGILVLAAMGLTGLGSAVKRKSKEMIVWQIPLFLLWGYAFWAIYELSLRRVGARGIVYGMWQGAFPQEGFWQHWNWAGHTILNAFRDPLGMPVPLLGVLLFFFGCYKVYLKDKEKFFLFFSPILVSFVAANFHKYPFSGRLILFLVPLLLIFLAQGTASVLTAVKKFKPVTAFLLIAALFLPQLWDTGKNFVHGREKEDLRAMMRIFKKEFQPQDALYMNTSSRQGYGYYISRLDVRRGIPIVGEIWDHLYYDRGRPYARCLFKRHVWGKTGYLIQINPGDIKKVHFIYPKQWIENSHHPRTWVLLSHVDSEMKEFLTEALKSAGFEVKSFAARGASLAMFDLSVSPEKTHDLEGNSK